MLAETTGLGCGSQGADDGCELVCTPGTNPFCAAVKEGWGAENGEAGEGKAAAYGETGGVDRSVFLFQTFPLLPERDPERPCSVFSLPSREGSGARVIRSGKKEKIRVSKRFRAFRAHYIC